MPHPLAALALLQVQVKANLHILLSIFQLGLLLEDLALLQFLHALLQPVVTISKNCTTKLQISTFQVISIYNVPYGLLRGLGGKIQVEKSMNWMNRWGWHLTRTNTAIITCLRSTLTKHLQNQNRALIMMTLIIFHHLELSSWHSDQGNLDLCKNSSILPCSVLSVARRAKILTCNPPKALLSVAKGDYEILIKPLKALFEE